MPLTFTTIAREDILAEDNGLALSMLLEHCYELVAECKRLSDNEDEEYGHACANMSSYFLLASLLLMDHQMDEIGVNEATELMKPNVQNRPVYVVGHGVPMREWSMRDVIYVRNCMAITYGCTLEFPIHPALAVYIRVKAIKFLPMLEEIGKKLMDENDCDVELIEEFCHQTQWLTRWENEVANNA